jgi:hypothetical protein
LYGDPFKIFPNFCDPRFLKKTTINIKLARDGFDVDLWTESKVIDRPFLDFGDP